jgi:nucleoside phosphorylase
LGRLVQMATHRALVLTALQVEYIAVRAHLTNLREVTHSQGTVYEIGDFTANNGIVWQVCLAEIGAGNAGAAVEAERAITHFEPQVVMFIGVAGGLKDVSIGDVVVATKVYGYDSGKAGRYFQPRPVVFNSAYELQQRARAEAKREDWIKRIANAGSALPNVFVGPIAAGGTVLASRQSALFEFLRKHYGDTLAVEMEGSGFLEAAHANQNVRAVVVRGISDLIKNKQDADASGCQTRAASNASAFAFEVLAKVGCRPSASPAEYRNPGEAALTFEPDHHIESLIKDVKLGDWDASADAAIAVICRTLADGSNPSFAALLRYYRCPIEDLKWAALQTVESCVALSPSLIDRGALAHMANHADFSIRASAASICLELASYTPDRVPVDILIALSVHNEDWYVQAPANAALKTMLRAMPMIFRIFLGRLRSADPQEREHAAAALADVAKQEPELLNVAALRVEVKELKSLGDKNALKVLSNILSQIRTVRSKKRYKYGL